MSEFSLNTALARLENKLRRSAQRVKHVIKKPYSPISVLNDDVLLHIFYIHRLHIKVDSEDNWHGTGYPNPFYDRQRWWYKLAHVSRRWRRVIFSAPTLLDLHLVCTSGVPVADMLAHSPPLPLIIFYWHNNYSIMKVKDEKGALLALSHRDRVRHITLRVSWELEKLFVAMDGQFPILERLNIDAWILGAPVVTLPRTFEAPNLSHVWLTRVGLPTRCPLLTTTGLAALRLDNIPGSYFPPSYILESLSLMPQLEILWIMFEPGLSHGVWPGDTAITGRPLTHVTLANLCEFVFQGVSAYCLEGLCAWMTTPVLSIFCVRFPYPITFFGTRNLSFMQTSEILPFHTAELICSRDYVRIQGVPQPRTWEYPLNLRILCRHLDLRILSAIQIINALSPVLSVVEQVTLVVNGGASSQWHSEFGRFLWRGLFRSFSNVKKLHVETDVGDYGGDYGIGHSLRTNDGEQPLELFPNLEDVSYSGSDDENDFTPFINEREAVGRPVRLILQSR